MNSKSMNDPMNMLILILIILLVFRLINSNEHFNANCEDLPKESCRMTNDCYWNQQDSKCVDNDQGCTIA